MVSITTSRKWDRSRLSGSRGGSCGNTEENASNRECPWGSRRGSVAAQSRLTPAEPMVRAPWYRC